MSRKIRRIIPLVLLVLLVMIMIPPVQTALAADPSAVNGRTLSTSRSGDNAEWFEIARYNDYSLIIRKDAVGDRKSVV